MRLSDSTVEQLLVKKQKITAEQLEKLKDEQKQNNRPLQDLVVKSNVISDKELTKIYAEYADIPFIEIDPKAIDKAVLEMLPEKIARQYNAVVFAVEGDTKQLAMEDPDDVQAVDFLQKQISSDYKLFVATKENILSALENYRDGVAEELSDVIAIQEEEESKEEVSEEDIAENSPIAKTVNLILEYAIRSSASDIHIEPREEFLQVRYRIDGVLKEANKLPPHPSFTSCTRLQMVHPSSRPPPPSQKSFPSSHPTPRRK